MIITETKLIDMLFEAISDATSLQSLTNVYEKRDLNITEKLMIAQKIYLEHKKELEHKESEEK